MNKNDVIASLSELGNILRVATTSEDKTPFSRIHDKVPSLGALLEEIERQNPWFIPPFVTFALNAWGSALQQEKVEKWLGSYPLFTPDRGKPKTVGIVMAGNIPLVGFHDLICVLASGNNALVKLSSHDTVLTPVIIELLASIQPSWKESVEFTDGTLKGFDAVIATGSDNTSRYFDYYFGKYPHIIRKNRNSIAVVSGKEDKEWYDKLADDIFLFFGLGCRNISKIYLPDGYNPEVLFNHFEKYTFMRDHSKFCNNYDYQKSICLINNLDFHDNGFFLLKKDAVIASPIAALHFEHYRESDEIQEHLNAIAGLVQCIVSDKEFITGSIPAGLSQVPELWDYADGIDTLDFLINL